MYPTELRKRKGTRLREFADKTFGNMQQGPLRENLSLILLNNLPSRKNAKCRDFSIVDLRRRDVLVLQSLLLLRHHEIANPG